jgi:Porin PorA
MRRIFGVTLTALGAFLIVGAIMCHFYLPGQVVKFPLNEYSVSRLAGTNVSYFSPQTGNLVTGASVRAVSTTQGDVRSGSSSTAVWNNITGVFDVTSSPQVPISYSTVRYAFDRRTGALVNCAACGAEVGTARPKFSGQSFVWPIGTQQQTYQVFNTSTMKPEPTNFIGTDTVDGLSVDVFVQPINNKQIGTITVPGSLVNITDQATVTLPEYLTATNTYYVDPGTGAPVKVIEAQNQTLANPSTGGTALVLFNGTLTSTPASVAAAVNTARHYDGEISAVQTIGPLAGALVGLLLLVAGILLLLGVGGEEYEYEEYDDDEAVGAEA